MIPKTLTKYIQEKLQKGEAKDVIQKKLEENGWKPETITEAFEEIKSKVIDSPSEAPKSSPEKESQGRSKKGLILSIIGVLFLGGIVFGYFYWYVGPISFQKMILNISNIKSVEYIGNIKIETQGAFQDDTNPITGTISGAFDNREENPKMRSNITISADMIQELGLSDRKIKLETRTIDKKIYFNLKGLLSGFPPEMMDLIPVDQGMEWIEISQEYLESLGEEYASMDSGIEQVLEEREAFIEEIKIQMLRSLESTDMGQDMMKGMSVQKYEFNVNKKEFIESMIQSPYVQEMIPEMPTEAEIQEIRETFPDIQGIVWIGKGNYPYKIEMNISLGDGEMSLFGEMLLKNFNQEVEILPPENAFDIVPLLQMFMNVDADTERRLNQSENSRRSTDVATILESTLKYQVDNFGEHIETIHGSKEESQDPYYTGIQNSDMHYYMIGTCADSEHQSDPNITDCTAAMEKGLVVADADNGTGNDGAGTNAPDRYCLDLSPLVNAGYMAIVPTDPQNGTNTATGYYFVQKENGSLLVGACEPETEGGVVVPDISVMR